jgi:hypothetical protein
MQTAIDTPGIISRRNPLLLSHARDGEREETEKKTISRKSREKRKTPAAGWRGFVLCATTPLTHTWLRLSFFRALLCVASAYNKTFIIFVPSFFFLSRQKPKKKTRRIEKNFRHCLPYHPHSKHTAPPSPLPAYHHHCRIIFLRLRALTHKDEKHSLPSFLSSESPLAPAPLPTTTEEKKTLGTRAPAPNLSEQFPAFPSPLQQHQKGKTKTDNREYILTGRGEMC